MDDDYKLPDLRVMMALALALSLGILCNILAGALFGNWWPMVIVIFYFIAPLPDLLCSRCGQNDVMNVSGRNFKDLGYFLTGVLVISGFGLPAVLAHNNVIGIPALCLSLGGGLIVYASLVIYIHFFHAKAKDDF